MDARDIKPHHFAQLPDSQKEAHLRALAEQPDTVTGYFVMDDGLFGGAYTFHNNKDKFDIHWPPNVVPVAPPEARSGEVAKWDGSAWVLVPDTRFKGDNSDIPNPLFGSALKNHTEEERLRLLPMPTGAPVPNEHGEYPMTVLNEERTAWVWRYPESGDSA